MRRMDGYALTILSECNQPARLDVLLTTRLVVVCLCHSLFIPSIGLSSTLTAFFSLSFPLALLPSLFHSLPLTTPLRTHSLAISLPLSSTHHTTQNSLSCHLSSTHHTTQNSLSPAIFQLSSTLLTRHRRRLPKAVRTAKVVKWRQRDFATQAQEERRGCSHTPSCPQSLTCSSTHRPSAVKTTCTDRGGSHTPSCPQSLTCSSTHRPSAVKTTSTESTCTSGSSLKP
jgi:hypothetical protein